MNKQSAFTLAEVLITLTVIGVVAALSIPTLLSSSNATADVTQLKKTYATLSNAVKLYEAENGSLKTAFSGDGSDAADVDALNAIAPYLNIIKNCGSDTGCFHDSALKYLGGTNEADNLDTEMNGRFGKAILADGTMLRVDDYSGACSANQGTGPLENTCGAFIVDINGAKGPNQHGRDFFHFEVTESGVYPYGAYDTNTCETNSTTIATSTGCTAKILAEGAINY